MRDTDYQGTRLAAHSRSQAHADIRDAAAVKRSGAASRSAAYVAT
jgi:hypothetical protein